MDSKETVWLVKFVSVSILDIALLLLTGVVFTIYCVVKLQTFVTCVSGKVQQSDYYNADKTINQIEQAHGIKIFRYEASIFFANAVHFRDKLYKKTGLHPKRLKKEKMWAIHESLMRRKHELELSELIRKRKPEKKARRVKNSEEKVEVMDKENEQKQKLYMHRFTQSWQPPIKTVIIDVTVVNHIDSVGVNYLIQIVNDYKEVGIHVFLVGCKPALIQILSLTNIHRVVDYSILCNTVQEAVAIAQNLNQRGMMLSTADMQLMKVVTEKTESAEETINKKEREEYGMSLEDNLDTIGTEKAVYDMDNNNTNDVVHLLQKTDMSDASKGLENRFDLDITEMTGSHSLSQRDKNMATVF